MADIIYYGEVESLSPKQKGFLSKVIRERGCVANKVLIETLGKLGNNFMADVKRITVHSDNGAELRIVAKIASRDETFRDEKCSALIFSNESLMYADVLPKFVNLQKRVGVLEEEQLKYAQYYGILMEELDELILLEDLHVTKLNMLDKYKSLTNENVKLALRNVAIFHSLSFVLKKQEPNTFKIFRDKLGDFFDAALSKESFRQELKIIEEGTIAILDSENYKNAVRNTVTQFPESFVKAFKENYDSDFSVIIQGDLWTNNLMFREEGGKSVECIMIDYQLSKVANPVSDVLYMIFNCTDYNMRHQYYNEWINHYHNELDKSLSNFGLKAENVYSRSQLDVDLKKYSKVYFAITIMLSALILAGYKDKEEQTVSKVIETTDKEQISWYKTKIEGLIDTYSELGYNK